MRRIVCEKVFNMRDLGGYLTKDNKVTKFMRFIRSNLPKDMTEDEINYLKNNNITTIIDLRKTEELERNQNCLNISDFNYYNINLKGDKCPEVEQDIPNGYMEILDNKETMSQVFHIIANSSGGVLFNCSAGKDRTGVVAMLLLLLANVYEDDIIADYMVSYAYIRNQIRKMHIDNPDLPAFLGGSKLEYMEETLRLFKEKYDNIYEYMKYLGITLGEVESIKNKLLN